MREIPLTRGKVALVDDCDYEWLTQWKWCARPVSWRGSPKVVWYAVRKRLKNDGGRRVGNISMHTAILGLQKGEKCDHRDGDGLNNQRWNLRRCTEKQNQGNRGKDWDNQSGYKGVRFKDGKFEVSLKSRYLGRFTDPRDAARAYDTAAVDYYGEFARTNAMMGLV